MFRFVLRTHVNVDYSFGVHICMALDRSPYTVGVSDKKGSWSVLLPRKAFYLFHAGLTRQIIQRHVRSHAYMPCIAMHCRRCVVLLQKHDVSISRQLSRFTSFMYAATTISIS